MPVYKSKPFPLKKNVSVSYHPKVIRQTVPFCRSGEREGTFSEFCTQSWFRVAAGACACWTQTRSTTVFCWRAQQFSEIRRAFARRESGASECKIPRCELCTAAWTRHELCCCCCYCRSMERLQRRRHRLAGLKAHHMMIYCHSWRSRIDVMWVIALRSRWNDRPLPRTTAWK